jgi:hypothetical protein
MGDEVEAAAEEAAFKEVSTDLMGIWDDKGVSLPIRKKLARAGFTSVAVFSTLADSTEKLRTILHTDLGIPEEGLPARAIAGSIITAWEAARKFVEVRAEVEAEARDTRVPVTMVRNDHINMRRAYQEATKGPLEDKHCPGIGYVEWRFEKIQEGDLRAEGMKEIYSINEETPDHLMDGVTTDRSGNLRVRKLIKEGTYPRDSEELRDKIKLVDVNTSFAQGRFPHTYYLKEIGPKDWEQHISYVLGDQVAGLRAKGPDGEDFGAPSWELVVSYEFQLRRKAYDMIAMAEVTTLKEGLRLARKDQELRQKHFLTSWTTSLKIKGGSGGGGNRRSRSRSRGNQHGDSRRGRGRGGRGEASHASGSNRGRKGASKGSKGKGGRGGGRGGGLPPGLDGLPRKQLTSKSPKKPICYSYNLAGERCSGCNRAHVCWWCEEKHSGHTCKLYQSKKNERFQ